MCIVVGIFLTGCTSNASPTTQVDQTEESQKPETSDATTEILPSIVRFPDSSIISLAPDAYIEIASIEELTSEEPGHEIMLHRGKIEVNSQLPEGIWFTVFNRNYYLARVTGSIMILYFDSVTGQFMMDCVEGLCEFGMNLQNMQSMAENHQGCIDEEGNFFGPFDGVSFDELKELCVDIIPTDTPTTETTETNTPTTSQTPDSEATATASCKDFESQFPGTPCP
jgi:hypothetical protein